MANSAEVDKSILTCRLWLVPSVFGLGLMLTVTGLAGWLNDVSAGYREFNAVNGRICDRVPSALQLVREGGGRKYRWPQQRIAQA